MTTVAALTHVRVRLSGPNITRATANIKQAFVVEQYSSTVEIAPLHIQILKKQITLEQIPQIIEITVTTCVNKITITIKYSCTVKRSKVTHTKCVK